MCINYITATCAWKLYLERTDRPRQDSTEERSRCEYQKSWQQLDPNPPCCPGLTKQIALSSELKIISDGSINGRTNNRAPQNYFWEVGSFRLRLSIFCFENVSRSRLKSQLRSPLSSLYHWKLNFPYDTVCLSVSRSVGL